MIKKQTTVEPILVIGDTHIPFEKEGYLEFCYEQKKKYKCTKIIHIGDLVDLHSTSYHEINPDGLSPKYELLEAKQHLKKWHKAFPVVNVILGNHDRLIQRKLFTIGISKEWMNDYSNVLDLKDWTFNISLEYGNINFIHGEGGKVINKALNRRRSIVQGHYHTQSSIEYNVSDFDRIFAVQTGCGINDKAYSFEYAKDFVKKSIISCAVIVENGTIPIICPMQL